MDKVPILPFHNHFVNSLCNLINMIQVN